MSTPASIGFGARWTGLMPASTPGLPTYEPLPFSVGPLTFIAMSIQRWWRRGDSSLPPRAGARDPQDPGRCQAEHGKHSRALELHELGGQSRLRPHLGRHAEDRDGQWSQNQADDPAGRLPAAEGPHRAE